MQIEVVATAYDELKALNLTPTVRKLRERIGFGSMTDITELLAQVRSERAAEDAAAVALPDRLKVQCDRFLFQLWAALRAEADEKLLVLENAAEEKVEEAKRDHRILLLEADSMMLEIDAMKLRIEELQIELSLEKALRTDRERDIAVAEQRLADQTVRTTALQHSLDIALSSTKPLPAKLVSVARVTYTQVAEVLKVIALTLEDGVALNANDVANLPQFSNKPAGYVSKCIEALLEKGQVTTDQQGALRMVMAPEAAGKRKPAAVKRAMSAPKSATATALGRQKA